MRPPPIAFVLLLLAACNSSTTVTRTARFPTQPPDKVDLLFVVDNFAARPMQEALGRAAPLLTQALASSPLHVSYHLGVITSDNGANSFSDSLKQCQPGSDEHGGGRLQAKGEVAPSTCLPPVGANYLEIDRSANTTNAPEGQSLETTFGCMLDVGDIGCGFQQPLETSFLALTDTTIAENVGFLRDEALLVVLYLMDEDDCSAPPTSDVYDRQPSTPPPEGLGLLNSYRCNKWGVVCFDPATGETDLMPYGAATGLAECRPASAVQGNRLHDVNRYIDLFTKPKSEGGLKAYPDDVIVAAILGDPPETLSTRLGNPQQQGPDGNGLACDPPLGQSCAVLVDHACVNPVDKRFFASPAVRLAAVVRATSNHAVHSICETDDAPVMTDLVARIATRTEGVRCLPYAVDNLKKCEATEASRATGKTVRALAACDAAATNRPCWRLGTDARCDRVDGDPTLIVERDDQPAPDTEYVLRCVD